MAFRSAKKGVLTIMLSGLLVLNYPVWADTSPTNTKYGIKKLSVTYKILKTNEDLVSITNQTVTSCYPSSVIPDPTGSGKPPTLIINLGPIGNDKRSGNDMVVDFARYGFFKRVEVQAELANVSPNEMYYFDWVQQMALLETNNDTGAVLRDTGNGGTDWVDDTIVFVTHNLDPNNRVYTWDMPGFNMGSVPNIQFPSKMPAKELVASFRDKVTRLYNAREYKIGTDQWSPQWGIHIKIDSVQQPNGNWAPRSLINE